MAGKAKGTAVVGVVKALRTMKDEALLVLPEPMHHYLGARIMAASWYPEEHLLSLIQSLLEITPGNRNEKLRKMGVATARALGEGVYSHLMVNNGSAAHTLALWSSMHDTGKLLSHKDEDTGAFIFDLENYANPSLEMCAITSAFIQEALRKNGHMITLKKSGCVLDGGSSCHWTSN